MAVLRTHLILFVADRVASTAFYERVLAMPPTLDVPGMTEFALGGAQVLGLMPETGIERLLEGEVCPSRAAGVARSELYLVVDDPAAYHARALASGAEELSKLALRDWGDRVAYSRDPDGHVLAIAAMAAA